MTIEILLYETGVALLAVAMLSLGGVLRKLTTVVNKKQGIWVLPVIGALVLFVSLGAHAYASFTVFPSLEAQIKLLSNDDVLFNTQKLAAVKTGIAVLKQQAVALKALSFTCFFIASAMLAAATAVYMRWISK
jgi:hypothetical protein